MRKAKITSEKPYRLNLRLTEKEIDFVEKLAAIHGVDKSKAIRILLDTLISREERENVN